MADPAEIRIDDLASPILTPAQQGALAYGEGLSVDLSEDAVLARACQRTGLHDFGDADFRERLRVWLAAVEEDRELGNIGRLAIREHIVRILCNRLRIEELVSQRPEILSLPIERPIIVAGLPRSGTTHLVNLLAADTRLRSVPYWESMEPVPVPGEAPGRDGLDPRYLRCLAAYNVQRQQAPLLAAMHDMPPEHVHEEIELLEIDLGSYNLEWLALVPRWRDAYLSWDLTSSYAYLKKALQVLQHHRAGERWVLKCPQHMEQLGPLMRVFPDATVVFTHRDPAAVIQSAITMLAYGDRMRRTRVDPPALAAYWIDRIERILRACVRDHDEVPAEQAVDLLFHEFMADEMGSVERVYRTAGLELTDAARRELTAFLEAHRRGAHGRVVYDLEGDFGVSASAIRERFGFYSERFAVAPESR